MAAIHGMTARIYGSSLESSMTDEATTDVGGTQTVYQITDTAKRVLDPNEAITVKADAVALDPTLYDINHPEGKILFYVARGALEVITVTADYVSLNPELTNAIGWTLELDLDVQEDTDFATAISNGGWRTLVAGLKGWSVTLENWWQNRVVGAADLSSGSAYKMGSDKLYYIKMVPNNGSSEYYHGWCMMPRLGTTAPAGTLVDMPVTLQGTGYIAYYS